MTVTQANCERMRTTQTQTQTARDGTAVTDHLKTVSLAHTAIVEQWKDHSLHPQ